MSDYPEYEVVVVGGGPAGLATALYTTRLGHRTAVFEKAGGRHAAVSHVHNLPGVSEDVSGRQLADLACRQLEEYGGEFYPDAVDDVRLADGTDSRFVVEATHGAVAADRVVFATGFRDVPPDVPDLRRFTGRGLHYCLHCDAYTLGDAPVFVLGHDEHAAEVAMLMLNFTADVDLLLDGREPEWDEETDRLVRGHPVERIDREVVGAFPEAEDGGSADGGGDGEPWLGGLTFADGTEREYLGGFAMYGTEYNAGLAESLGCDLTGEGAIAVDERYETSVAGAYAVGDVTHGQNQTTVAIGDGARAGIALHRDLRRFPLSAEELAAVGGREAAGDRHAAGGPDLDAPGLPPDVRARMRRDRDRDTHAGLREPRPDR